ncbi:SDR family oxidoreductase [Vibrio mangrovi]|uniref:C-factor n=1 Tax=Vibrio mangrovi TaxID=474394 RepID=A0A1Y6IT38_9VIBR|nr:SDR family oxidoreductase [Vibrio mangrovi]MDW6004529.1 SDR family oxidoreductase [Vibrio mangrovi]SMS00817.1 C-factor [Vibrio mangrovi]
METVLITGASRGIGLELARQFKSRGYKVIATYRGTPSAALARLADNEQVQLVELEVTDNQAIARLGDELKGICIDILINNAGIIGPERQRVDAMNCQGWLDTFAVNTIAPFMVSTTLLANLKLAENPRIITISSNMGALSEDATGMYAYRSSKAAVNKVMKGLALELRGQGITVCPVEPGWVRTDMGGPSATLSAHECAADIAELAHSLTLKQSGKFFTWQGKERSW